MGICVRAYYTVEPRAASRTSAMFRYDLDDESFVLYSAIPLFLAASIDHILTLPTRNISITVMLQPMITNLRSRQVTLDLNDTS